MALPAAAVPAIVTAAGGTLSSGINAFSTGNMNKKNRRWNETMYERQFNDNKALWDMQNDYNHPSAQMQRLREAGLNPHLVYGSGAKTESDSIKPASYNNTPGTAPQFDFGGVARDSISAYLNYQMQEAQTNNLKAQNNVLVQESALKAAQIWQTMASTSNTEMNTKRSQFDLNLASELRNNSLEVAKEQLRKIQTETDVTLNKDAREAAMTTSNLNEAVVRVAKAQAEINNVKLTGSQIKQMTNNLAKDSKLKQLDIELKEKGIQPHHPIWAQTAARLAEKFNILDGKTFNFWTMKSKLHNAWKNRPK